LEETKWLKTRRGRKAHEFVTWTRVPNRCVAMCDRRVDSPNFLEVEPAVEDRCKKCVEVSERMHAPLPEF
jgi:hypothetical protein